jgi:uncharacterized protein YPO0396
VQSIADRDAEIREAQNRKLVLHSERDRLADAIQRLSTERSAGVERIKSLLPTIRGWSRTRVKALQSMGLPLSELRGGIRLARQDYNEERTTSRSLLDLKHAKEMREETNRKQLNDARQELRDSLKEFIEQWTPIHSFNRHDAPADAVHIWIRGHLSSLRGDVLRDYEESIIAAKESLIESARSDFLFRLKEQFADMHRKLRDLSNRLESVVFNGESYSFKPKRLDSLGFILDLVDRLEIVQTKLTPIFEASPDAEQDPDVQNIRKLMALLTGEDENDGTQPRPVRRGPLPKQPDKDRPRGVDLAMLADYRQYYAFEIDILDAKSGKRLSDVSQRLGKGSGGERYVPFYIIIGTAVAGAYFDHLGGRSSDHPQSALLLLDEAFEKLDPGNILSVIAFYHNLGLQLLVAAPKTNRGLYIEALPTIANVTRFGRALGLDVVHYHERTRARLRSDNPIHDRPE